MYLKAACRHKADWGVLWLKQVSREGTNHLIPQYMWDVSNCACPWKLSPAQHFRVTGHSEARLYDVDIVDQYKSVINLCIPWIFHGIYYHCLTQSKITSENVLFQVRKKCDWDYENGCLKTYLDRFVDTLVSVYMFDLMEKLRFIPTTSLQWAFAYWNNSIKCYLAVLRVQCIENIELMKFPLDWLFTFIVNWKPAPQMMCN